MAKLLDRVATPTTIGAAAYGLAFICSAYLLKRDIPALLAPGTLAEVFSSHEQTTIAGLKFSYDFLTVFWPLIILALVYLESLSRTVALRHLDGDDGPRKPKTGVSLLEALYLTRAAAVLLTIVVVAGLAAHAAMFWVAIDVLLHKNFGSLRAFFPGASSIAYVKVVAYGMGVALAIAFLGLLFRRKVLDLILANLKYARFGV